VLTNYPNEHEGWDQHPIPAEDFPIYPEELFHLHGKALSGVRHAHPLRDGESRDEPDHEHEGDEEDETGRAIYWHGMDA
jgi:hypothetical protein